MSATPAPPPHPPRLDPALHERRERVFLLLAGFFLGAMTMLNILGTSRFLDLSFEAGGLRVPLLLAVGVLPYPITFLCTDFISELYGRRRANFVVLVGFVLNLFVVGFLWLGGALPPAVALGANGLPSPDAYDYAFFRIRQLTTGAVAASMCAYLVAQFVDVQLFHFWKRLTRGRHLWLRNNGSTVVSQFVDSCAVILVVHFWARGLPVDAGAALWPQLWTFILSSYFFKLAVALLDTLPFYVGVYYLARYLKIDPRAEHQRDFEVGRVQAGKLGKS